MNLRPLHHRLCRHASFRVRFGDGTLSHRMRYSIARDYRDAGEDLVFDPLHEPDYFKFWLRTATIFCLIILVGGFCTLIYIGAIL